MKGTHGREPSEYSVGQEVMGMLLDPVFSSDLPQLGGKWPCSGRGSVVSRQGGRASRENSFENLTL